MFYPTPRDTTSFTTVKKRTEFLVKKVHNPELQTAQENIKKNNQWVEKSCRQLITNKFWQVIVKSLAHKQAPLKKKNEDRLSAFNFMCAYATENGVAYTYYF